MNKLPISKEELLNQYKKEINDLLDECDWIDHIDDWRMIGIVVEIFLKKV